MTFEEGQAGDQESTSSQNTHFYDSTSQAQSDPHPEEEQHSDPQSASQSETRTSDPEQMLNYNFFDYLLDTALGRSNEEASRTDAPSNEPAADATASGPTNGPGTTEPSTTGDTDQLASNLNAYHPLGFVGTDPSGSIIITVNYMFLDGTEGDGPGRTGSLVVTLPNNPSNREPRAIQQFISLATRMAYLVLVNNTTRKRGITPDKFREFPVKPLLTLNEQSCAICFERFEEIHPIDDDLDCITKKRKMNLREPTPTATSSNDREHNTTLESCSAEWKHVPVELPCGHIFGQSCLAHWLNDNRSCPLCRKNLCEGEEGDDERSEVPPVTYLRFGGPGNGGMHLYGDNPRAQSTERPEPEANEPQEETQPPTGESEPDTQSQDHPGLLRRATSVIFHPHRLQLGRNALERTMPGFSRSLLSSNMGRRRNSPVSPMITQILNLFGRNRRRREEDQSGASSIFASGVSSRRTANGVETTTNENGHNLDESAFGPDFNQGLSNDTPQ